MKVISLVSLVLLFSCTREKTPGLTGNFLSLNGRTKTVKSWSFRDQSTGENYDLLDNSEIDKIYITFLDDRLLIVHEEIENGDSYFGWRTWDWDADIPRDRVVLHPDQLTHYEITRVDENRLGFSGMHELHLQPQQIDIQMITAHDIPQKVLHLIQQYK